ncbi:hypothetical protein PINS_up023144 [Pythium insidiosum]|nr:hypothetical protein PINS_up023144 [Pythium insidiosum]
MLAHEGKEILKLMLGGVALSTLFIVTGGYAVETAKGMNPMPAPGRFVQLVGSDGTAVKIHYQRRGSGDVTVLFDVAWARRVSIGEGRGAGRTGCNGARDRPPWSRLLHDAGRATADR